MSYKNPRIKSLATTPLEVMVDFAEGNPGAITVLSQLFKESPAIDPDAAFEGMSPLFSLDNLDCYGSDIWVLYKDVCGQDIVKMLGVLRAIQLGFVSDGTVKAAMTGGGSVDPAALLEQVKERLPDFAKAEA